MTEFNATNIITQWSEMTPKLREQNIQLYRDAMSKTDLVAQWDKLTPIQKQYLGDLYKSQRNEKYKIHKKRAQAAAEKNEQSIKMDNFNQRFIMNIMNRYAPKGYRFVLIGSDRRIAIESAEIMGNQKPRGAFVSDISFDMIEGVYGSLFKNDKEAFTSDTIYWRMRGFIPDKPYRTTKEKHEQYVKTLEGISRQTIPYIDFLQSKPNTPWFRQNAIIVQGIMDSGKAAPKFLNDRLHKAVNSIVWWTFRRAMRQVKASKLVKYKNSYKKTMNRINVVPGTRSGFTMWRDDIDLKKRTALRAHLEHLQYDVLAKAAEDKNPQLVAKTQSEISKIKSILGADYEVTQKPARDMLRDTFYTKQKVKQNGTTVIQKKERVFSDKMHVLKQFWLLVTAKESKSKTK